MMTIEHIHRLRTEEFVHQFGRVYEHSEWVAKQAANHRPFSTVEALHAKMREIVDTSSHDAKKELLLAHPNLGERIQMTDLSKNEQQNAGLSDLTPEEYRQFLDVNKTYMETFGFPFIMAVSGKDKKQIYQQMQVRVKNTYEVEFNKAIQEVHTIALIRLNAICL